MATIFPRNAWFLPPVYVASEPAVRTVEQTVARQRYPVLPLSDE